MDEMTEIPVIRPWMDETEEAAVVEVLRSGWVMAGPKTKTFETRFAAAVQAPHACAVSSCTAGLHLALRAVGVRPGDAVLTVSHSFIASANAVRLAAAEPVFVDIDANTLNMDATCLRATLEKDFELRDDGLWYGDVDRIAVGESPLSMHRGRRGRLSAILVIHQVGCPADMAAILAVADTYGIPIIEDAACAIGSEVRLSANGAWQPIGHPLGAAACFSFHPRKVITTGEGGMVTTADPDVDHKVRMWRQHGMDLSPAERHARTEFSKEVYQNTTGNHRMTDIQAALGIRQLERLSEIVRRRREIAARYLDGMAGLNGLYLPMEPDFARTNYQSFVIQLADPGAVPGVRRFLKDRGIDTRPGIMCAHREPPYRESWPDGSLPESERAERAGIILPLFPTMSDEAVERVIKGIRSATQRVV